MEFAAWSLPSEGLPLEQQVARLQALLEATRKVHSTIQADEVLMEAASILVRELEMAGAMFVTAGAANSSVVFGELPEPPYENCVRFPLLSKDGEPLAELIISTQASGDLSLYEQDFVEGLVLQTAVALENATLHERDVEWARVQQDLDAARAIQRSLLPRVMPKIPSISIAGRSTTCYEVGGDYLDIVELADGSFLMAVADVAGKGLASAIMSTSFRAAFRGMAATGLSLDELATRMNQHHWAEGEEARRRYVTAIFLRMFPGANKIEVVNAGHNPGFLIEPGAEPHQFQAAGPPLGLLPGMRYSSERHSFPTGSRLLFYTDGLTEVFKGDEEFGPERLLDEFSKYPALNADGILDALWAATAAFAEGGPQADDMTALAMCRIKSSGSKEITG
jgi:phosphoserine phosphatase RsbU/P